MIFSEKNLPVPNSLKSKVTCSKLDHSLFQISSLGWCLVHFRSLQCACSIVYVFFDAEIDFLKKFLIWKSLPRSKCTAIQRSRHG